MIVRCEQVVAAVGGMGYTGGRSAGDEVKDANRFVDADLSGGFADLVQTTQFATYHTCQLAAQTMLRHGDGGRIIVIGSVMSDMGRAGSAACAPRLRANCFNAIRCLCGCLRVLLHFARRHGEQSSHQAVCQGPGDRARPSCNNCQHHSARCDRHDWSASVSCC